MSTPAEDDDRTIIRAPAGGGAPASGTALPVGTVLGEFELTGEVAEGGFGIVYLALDRQLQRRVALKEFMPQSLAVRAGATQVTARSERHRETFEVALRSFVNEARALAQFDHPSLVKVYRFWEANGTAYMVMPYYEGSTLQDTVKAQGTPPDEAWLRQLLDPLTAALAVIHEAQWYHRDIAPDNILLLGGPGAPLLLDFGAARRVIGDMTQALTVILKPGYAPVEQYAEVPGMKQGAWTDIYALAAVVYWCITGKTPPPSVGRLLSDSYVPLADSAAGRYSPGFLAAIDRALAVHPQARTATIAAFRDDLGLGRVPERAATETSSPAVPSRVAAAPSASPPGSTAVQSGAAGDRPAAAAKGRWLAIGAVAVLAVGLGGFWMSRPGGSPTPAPVAAADKPSPVTAAPVSAGSAATLPQASPSTAASASPSAPAPTPAPTSAPAPAAAPPVATAPAETAPVAATPVIPRDTPPVAGAFDTLAELRRMVAGQTPGFAVTAAPAKPTMVIGKDKLRMQVTSARDGYYHVFAYGPDGVLYQILPNAQAKAHRIRAGQTLTLPPASSELNVAEPAGTEHLFVIVSDRPRDFSSLKPASAGWFRVLPSGQKAAALARALPPGSGPLYAGAPQCDGAAPCSAEYGAAAFEIEVVAAR